MRTAALALAGLALLAGCNDEGDGGDRGKIDPAECRVRRGGRDRRDGAGRGGVVAGRVGERVD